MNHNGAFPLDYKYKVIIMNLLTLPSQLPIARYRFTFQPDTELVLPPYAASTLRGVFGHALLNTVCTCWEPSQDGVHPADCPYSHIFATPYNDKLPGSRKHHPLQPYVIETPFKQQLQIYPAGSDYQFQIVLTGGARHMLPLIKAVFEYAFKKGIARQNVRCSLKNLEVETPDGWQGILEHGIIPLHPNTISLPQHFPSDVSIQLLTPLTIRYDKKVMKAGQLTESMFLRQAIRDISAIATTHWEHPLEGRFQELIRATELVRGRKSLTDTKWKRHSNRQQRDMTYQGVMGEWTFYDLPTELSALLYIGQWLHIGKETTFGHGGYRITAGL